MQKGETAPEKELFRPVFVYFSLENGSGEPPASLLCASCEYAVAPRLDIAPLVRVERGLFATQNIGVLAGINSGVEIAENAVWREVENRHHALLLRLANEGHQAVRCIVVDFDKLTALVARA